MSATWSYPEDASLSWRGTAALAAPALRAQNSPLTAQQAIERIQKNVGVPWRTDSADTVKAGDPSTVLTGIATTAMATQDVLARAVKEKANLILTCEPTFFAREEKALADDPVYTQKKDFIEKNRLVVWHFSDHWRDSPARSVGGWARVHAGMDQISKGR